MDSLIFAYAVLGIIVIAVLVILIRRYFMSPSNNLDTLIKDIQSEKEELTAKLEESILLVEELKVNKAELNANLQAKMELIAEHKLTENALRVELKKTEGDVSSLKADAREQSATLKAEASRIAELKDNFESQKIVFKNEFKVLSQEVLKTRQDELSEQNTLGMSALLRPLQDTITGFQKRVNEVHTETVQGNTNLEAAIKTVMTAGIEIRDDASNLTQALKGNSQQRGAWGEAQLERTLEMSGLIAEAHYEKQSSFKDTDGKQKQTDYLIKLPENKHLIIDSKVSLIAYETSVSAETEQARAIAMDDHVKSVKKHINDLASKDYTNLIGMRSPSFVLMFMPIESGYIESLKHDFGLFSYGYSKNIILVSHTTLIPILRTVSNLWMAEKSNKEARQLSDKAGDIYNAVCIVSERFQKLGNTLNTASNHFKETEKAIAGAQGLQGKVGRLTEISNKVSKKMPELESPNFEVDVSRLDIQAIELDHATTDLEFSNLDED